MINQKHTFTVLNQQDVLSCNVTDIDFAEQIVKKSFIKNFNGNVNLPSKTILKNQDAQGYINIMPCAILADKDEHHRTMYGVKMIGVGEKKTENNLRFFSCVIALFDHETKELSALVNGDIISAYRTAAVTRLLSRYILKPDKIKNILFIGAGLHMKIHLLALNIFLDKNVSVGVYSRGQSKYTFVEEMQQRTCSSLWAIDKLNHDIISSADVIIGCIPNNDINEAPVKKARLKKGAVFFNVGFDDCDIDTLLNMDKYYVDNWKMIKKREKGPIYAAYVKGLIKAEQIEHVTPFIAKNQSMRTSENEKILVSVVGMGSHDILFANEIYKSAISKNLGHKVELSHSFLANSSFNYENSILD